MGKRNEEGDHKRRGTAVREYERGTRKKQKENPTCWREQNYNVGERGKKTPEGTLGGP